MLQLISPFPAEQYPLLWTWLHESKESNFDDYGPTTYQAFVEEMKDRSERELSWMATWNDKPVGFIGYAPVNLRLGSTHGICFTKEVHGKGVAYEAVSRIVEQLFASGVEKIQACYFASNLRVAEFLNKLGFYQEGYFVAQTVRNGNLEDMRLVARFRSSAVIPVCPVSKID